MQNGIRLLRAYLFGIFLIKNYFLIKKLVFIYLNNFLKIIKILKNLFLVFL